MKLTDEQIERRAQEAAEKFGGNVADLRQQFAIADGRGGCEPEPDVDETTEEREIREAGFDPAEVLKDDRGEDEFEAIILIRAPVEPES